MKRLSLVLGILIALSSISLAQVSKQNNPFDNLKKDFNTFTKQAETEFRDFRHKANLEYARMLETSWVESEVIEPQDTVVEDYFDPTCPEQSAGIENECNEALTVLEAAPVAEQQPTPITHIAEYAFADQKSVPFMFYGTKCNVRFDDSQRFKLPEEVNKSEMAAQWAMFATEPFDNTVRDCLALRDQLGLNDWGYLLLLDKFSQSVTENLNDAALLMAYLYNQSGYKMRLLIYDNNLRMGYSTKYTIESKPYVPFPQGDNFYVMNGSPTGRLEISSLGYPKESDLSLHLVNEPRLDNTPANARTLQSKKYPEIKVNVKCDENIINFFKDYPNFQTSDNFTKRYPIYANMPMENSLKEQLYPQLQQSLATDSLTLCVRQLLDFVQTAFTYRYDEEVWGCDKIFFPEETIFYPYSDCEDRAILFTRLVRDLTPLDVVLVHYPTHMAAAVAFDQEVPGGSIMVNDRKYTICDPTLEGADLGYVMSNVDKSQATAILVK